MLLTYLLNYLLKLITHNLTTVTLLSAKIKNQQKVVYTLPRSSTKRGIVITSSQDVFVFNELVLHSGTEVGQPQEVRRLRSFRSVGVFTSVYLHLWHANNGISTTWNTTNCWHSSRRTDDNKQF